MCLQQGTFTETQLKPGIPIMFGMNKKMFSGTSCAAGDEAFAAALARDLAGIVN